MPDDEIIKRFCEGKADTVADVTEWARAAVLRRIWVPGIEPEDIVSETVINLLMIFRSEEFTAHTSLKAFVQSIAKCKAIDAVRKHRRERDLLSQQHHTNPPHTPSPLDILLTKQQEERWLEILRSIDEKCRLIWKKIFEENIHYSKVAASLRMTNGAMRTRLARCKAAAMKFLAK